jgi:hypothetical protein
MRGRRHIVAAISGLVILCTLALAGGYLTGAAGGADLGAARAIGRSDGAHEARRVAETKGYREGVRVGAKEGYRETYRPTFRAAKRKAIKAATPVVPAAAAAPPPAPAAPAQDGGLVPCTYGPEALCTPEENAREGAIESYCGGYDPRRVTADGDYIPKPGC